MAVKIFSGSSFPELADSIAKKFRKNNESSLNKVNIERHNDGEIGIHYIETIREDIVFIIQSTSSSENIMELLIMLDTAKRASVNKINVIIPYFGYARQDRKDKPRVPITAKLMANLLTTAGADRIITVDLHVDQIQGFFDIPVDHLSSSYIFLPYIDKNFSKDTLVIASPDVGGAKRASKYSKALDVDLIIIHKEREKAGVISSMKLIGDVNGKDVCIVDDLVDTAGSLTKATDLLIDNGAKSVNAFICHPLLTGNAYDKINKSKLTQLVVTDTLPIKPGLSDKIKVVSVDKMVSKAMKRIINGKSISNDIFGAC
jgi:ribose-phosphate pyrophosphokinase